MPRKAFRYHETAALLPQFFVFVPLRLLLSQAGVLRRIQGAEVQGEQSRFTLAAGIARFALVPGSAGTAPQAPVRLGHAVTGAAESELKLLR